MSRWQSSRATLYYNVAESSQAAKIFLVARHSVAGIMTNPATEWRATKFRLRLRRAGFYPWLNRIFPAQRNFVCPGRAIGAMGSFMSHSNFSGTSFSCEFNAISHVICWPV